MVIEKSVYKRLKEVARSEQTIFYGGIAELLGMDIHSQPERRKIGRLLDAICRYEYAQGRPLLPVVVIGERLKAPGKGFFDMARLLGVQNGEADSEFFAQELQRVHAFWRKSPAEHLIT